MCKGEVHWLLRSPRSLRHRIAPKACAQLAAVMQRPVQRREQRLHQMAMDRNPPQLAAGPLDATDVRPEFSQREVQPKAPPVSPPRSWVPQAVARDREDGTARPVRWYRADQLDVWPSLPLQRGINCRIDICPKTDEIQLRDAGPSLKEDLRLNPPRTDGTQLCDSSARASDGQSFAGSNPINDFTPMVAKVTDRNLSHMCRHCITRETRPRGDRQFTSDIPRGGGRCGRRSQHVDRRRRHTRFDSRLRGCESRLDQLA